MPYLSFAFIDLLSSRPHTKAIKRTERFYFIIPPTPPHPTKSLFFNSDIPLQTLRLSVSPSPHSICLCLLFVCVSPCPSKRPSLGPTQRGHCHRQFCTQRRVLNNTQPKPVGRGHSFKDSTHCPQEHSLYTHTHTNKKPKQTHKYSMQTNK